MRKVVVLFDEYSSQENAKHVRRAMRENAKQGFWNGSKRGRKISVRTREQKVGST